MIPRGREPADAAPSPGTAPPAPSPGTAPPAPDSKLARRSLRRRWRATLLGSVILTLVATVATARVLVWPGSGMPAHVDAIVMLDGPGDRLGPALQLARDHRAPVLVVSTSTPIRPGSGTCIRPIPRVRVICFNPDPQTTRGEAEFAGRLARHYRWRSLALVTIAPQNARARLRFARCFAGQIYAVDQPFPAYQWPYQILYEWGAMAKALVLQRHC